MELLNIVENHFNNFIEKIGKELSLVMWVSIVFILILCSYISSQNRVLEKSELNLNKGLSVSQEYRSKL